MKTPILTLNHSPISRFCFGCMQFGGKADAATSLRLYTACREKGINFFDTAHAYTDGTSETLLGSFIRAERDQVYIASKANFTGGAARANIIKSLDDSRKRMGVDTVDLYYLHRWDQNVPLEESFETLADLLAKGLIRGIGVSNYAAWQVMKAVRVAESFGIRITMAQPMYNLVKRQVEVEILPMCAAEGIAAVPYSPLGGGLLTGKYATGGEGRITTDKMYANRYAPDWMHKTAVDLAGLAHEVGVESATLAVAWVARNPAVTAPIISARSMEQIGASLAALDFVMDDALYARVSALAPAPPPATDRLEEAS